jgi:hypothetical protein
MATKTTGHLNDCYRLLDSLRRGLGNPAMTGERLEKLAADLRKLDRRVWR